MADDVNQHVEESLKCLVSVTEKSCNLRGDLKKDILESVSMLRKVFVELKLCLDGQHDENKKLKDEIAKVKVEMSGLRGRGDEGSGRVATSHDVSQQPRSRDRQPQFPGGAQPPPSLGGATNYSRAVCGLPQEGGCEKTYKLVITSKLNESADAMKTVLKRNINPTKLGVGVHNLKATKNNRIIIKSKKREDIDILNREINKECSQHLETNIPKLWNPNIIVYNIPNDVTKDNFSETVISQNPELNVKVESIRPKFEFRDKKKCRNLVAEVTPEAWRIMTQKKLKIGWHICNADNYINIVKCFKCCKFGHRAQKCTGDEKCPICAENHKLKECKASIAEYKCINSVSHNTYHSQENAKVNENHSSLDKNCPSLLAAVRKYNQNTEY